MNRMIKNKENLAKKGRNGDTKMAHVADGEMIVPPVISDELRAKIHAEMKAAGLPPEQYTMGEQMSINPATGLPEFGFFSKAWKVFKKVAPIAVSFIPGVGPIAGAVLGAGAGYLSGGNLKSALIGGAGGFVGAGGLGKVAGVPLSAGAKGANVAVSKGSGLLGKLSSNSGSLANALRGGAGIINSAQQGISSLGSKLGQTAVGQLASKSLGSVSKAVGADTVKKEAIKKIGGRVVKNTFGNILQNSISAYQDDKALKKAEKQQIRANQLQQDTLSPYLQSGIGANTKLSGLLGLGGENQDEILANLRETPGYQFQQQQGDKALNRSQASRGSFFSGRAIKEGARFNQDLANRTYNDTIDRYSMESGRGANVAGAQAGLQGQYGDIRANARLNRSQALNRRLADILNPRRYVDGRY